MQFDYEHKPRLLAVSASHSGDRLFALAVTSCNFRLDNEVVCMAVALRLGLPFGAPHTCQCGAEVDARGLHGVVCKEAPSTIIH